MGGVQEYKALYATQHRMPNKLVLPEGLKLVPLYALAVMKCKALRGGAKDVGLDDRVAVAYQMMSMSVAATLRFLYPTMKRTSPPPPREDLSLQTPRCGLVMPFQLRLHETYVIGTDHRR